MVQMPSIIWSQTKKNVEETISKYIYYNLSIDSGSDFKISDNFVYKMINDEDICTDYVKLSVEERKKRIEFINYVRFSFNKLNTEERKIVYWTYLDKEKNYDDSYIANNLGFSLGYYYIKKKDALIMFAYSLGVEKIKE